MSNRPPTNAELHDQIKDLTDAVKTLSDETRELVTAWKNATFLLALVKWLGTAVAAVSGFLYVMTHFGQGK